MSTTWWTAEVDDMIFCPDGVFRAVTQIQPGLVWTGNVAWGAEEFRFCGLLIKKSAISLGSNAPAAVCIGPKNCMRCNHRNEYLGSEHLSADGSYTCRGCK